MSGDNLYGVQPSKFYAEAMTETKKIALAHFEKKLFQATNSIIYLQLKHQETKVQSEAWEVPDVA